MVSIFHPLSTIHLLPNRLLALSLHILSHLAILLDMYDISKIYFSGSIFEINQVV